MIIIAYVGSGDDVAYRKRSVSTYQLYLYFVLYYLKS
jgi:hypothetical protein